MQYSIVYVSPGAQKILAARGITLDTYVKSRTADSRVVPVIRIENLQEWQQFCGALRPAATGGPRTPAEINAAAEKLWPKPKPLTPVWEKTREENL
jgi:hypothetical protein